MMQGNYLNENQRSGEQSTAVVDFITAFRQMNEAEQAQRMNTLLSDVDDFSRIIQNKRDFLSLCRELPELYVDACIRTITHTPSFFNLLVKRPEDFIFLRHSAEIGGRFIQAVVGNEAFFETLLNQYGEHSRIIFLRVEVLEGNLSRAMHDFIIRLEQETEQERANRIESVLTDRDYFYHIVKSEADFFQLCQILPETDFERLLQGILADPLFFRIIIKSQYSFSNFITQPDRGERIREVILGNDVVFYDCVDRYFSQDEKGEREFCRRFLSYVDVIMKYVERYNENKEAFKRCIEIYFFELQFMFSPDDFTRLKEDVLENEGFGQYLYNMIFSQENYNYFFS